MALLAEQLACPLTSTEQFGVPPDYVEAVAFAWLARQTMSHLTANLPAVTGAKQAVILGGIYQAGSTT
jgi:anhydro-N-acetylmuramic acid kinase